MGTYRSSHPMMSEANRTASIPRFSWFHPGTFLSSARIGYDPFQPTYINADVGTTPIPLHSVSSPPPDEIAANDNDAAVEHAEAKKPKNSKSKKTAENLVSKALKPKQTKKDPTKPSKKAKVNSIPLAKRERKDLTLVMYEGNVDISDVPTPFCSCTGVARQCYRWGAGGWQSSCCTINISEYPLPMNLTRPGSRMAGRKMSHGAYEKLLRRLSAEGLDLSHPIDLKQHWARHGTNKFVTIK